ncbi:MAG: metal ABC transporter permease [Thermoleophilia bacterium]|nr:metal ABC transporter permease [Thermoleophilia bacterium]GIK78365.1 MAG: iron ABC transporter permease [Actinomycetes bacterium]
MLDVLIEPLSDGIVRRALLELVIAGAVAGPLGVWIVLYGQSYAAESISHSMLPGLVLAALAGIPLGIGAAAGLALAAACVALASRQRAVGPDAAVAVAVTALVGAGTLLALSPEVPVRLGELLFGDPLAVGTSDLVASAALALAVLLALAGGHRMLALSAFDPRSARSLGGSDPGSAALLLGLLAATILIAVTALGNLLVVAILLAPGATALRLSARLGPALAVGAASAIGAGVAGIYVSYWADVAAGAAIAICAIAICAVALLPRPRPRRGGGHILRRWNRA